MVTRGSQVAVLAALAACESPARVKPWRHAPDPTAEAAHAPASPVLVEGAAEPDVHAARAHTLRIHLDSEPGRLNPILAPTVWGRRITLGPIFETLIRDGQGGYHPKLARSWRVMPGGLEIRIELEPDATFSDGHPLTTSDVQFTLDAVRDPHRGIDHLRPMLDDVEAIELITSREVRLRLKRPSGWVLRALAEIPILPMHVYDGSLLGGGQLVGTGPYKLASNKNGVVHLVRNDKYWAGPVAIADVEFVYQPDAAVALTAAKRGEIDIVPALIPAHWPTQAYSPGLAAAFVPLQLAPARMRYFAYNARRAPLDDANVRHALSLLVDRNAIAKRVFSGLARPMLWPIWPGGPVDGAEVPVPDLDPAAAGKLLDAAHWIDSDKDGYRDQAGKQLKLVLIGTERPQSKDNAGPPIKSERDYFVDAARKSGIMIEVRTGGEAWLERKIAEGNYDLVEQSWIGMTDSDMTPLLGATKLVPSKNAKDDVGPLRATSPRVERALDAMGAAWDPAERAKLAAELAAALAEVWPMAGIVADAPQGLVHKRVKGVRVFDGWIDLGALSFEKTP